MSLIHHTTLQYGDEFPPFDPKMQRDHCLDRSCSSKVCLPCHLAGDNGNAIDICLQK